MIGEPLTLLKPDISGLDQKLKQTLQMKASAIAQLNESLPSKKQKILLLGAAGTGKTFFTFLLAEQLRKEAYSIDLSMVVSKYVGETEKNLQQLFDKAEDKGWILFFDEADALFGKRTNICDAHDRYANLETAYFMQKIEEYNGTVIVATNSKKNIDEAFTRRFHSILSFPMMIPENKTPGVYVEEIPQLPPSIKIVQPIIPLFIGATQKAKRTSTDDLLFTTNCIHSVTEYENFYGFAKPETGITIDIDATTIAAPVAKAIIKDQSPYRMYYTLRHFFANGGDACYIISVGNYNKTVDAGDLLKGIEKASEAPGMTTVLFPDAGSLSATSYYDLCRQTLERCAEKNNSFLLIDVWRNEQGDYSINELRSFDLGDAHQLSFGAAYYPFLISSYGYYYEESQVTISYTTNTNLGCTLEEFKQKDLVAYETAKQSISQLKVLLPATPAIAGIFARVDNQRGIWKAPANEVINDVEDPELLIDNVTQEGLNVHASGKSINAIRVFPGKGVLPWGARTLAGNDNEWRYISVRRYFIMIEESLKSSTSFVVFEPNDATTWVRLKSMITDFLIQQWKQGALQGSKPEQVFFVKVGLNETMTSLDISEGRMIIEVGLAIIRPAEFIILRIAHLISNQ